MKKTLLSLAAAFIGSLTAMAGVPQEFSLEYQVGSVNTETELVGLEINVNYPGGDITTLNVNKSVAINVVAADGTSYTASAIDWNLSDRLTLGFSPAVTQAGTYSIEFPKGLFYTTGLAYVSSFSVLTDAFTLGTPAPAPTGDVISVATVNAALDAPLTERDPNNWEQVGSTGSLKGSATGTEYVFNDLYYNANDPSALEMTYMSSIYNTDAPAGYIKAVYGVTSAYFSTTPLDGNNYYLGSYAYTDSPELPVVPNGPATYCYLPGAPGAVSAITIEWGDEPNIGKAEAPYVYTNFSDNRPGTIVSASAYGFTVWIHATSSNGEEYTISAEDQANFTLEGSSGTTWTLEIWTSKEGCENSEVQTYTYTLQVAKLQDPYISYPSLDDGEHMPVNGIVTISNYNYDASYLSVGTIHYQINNGEVQEANGEVVTLRAVGEIGDAFEVTAWITAPGYEESGKYHMGAYLVTNVLETPSYNPNGGAVLPNTAVSINAPDYVEFIRYRVNDGEWQTVYNWDVKVNITENCTVEAYSYAGNPEEASYVDSPIVSATFTLEELADNEVIIDAPTLNLTNDKYDLSLYSFTNSVYGEFQYFGWTMSDTMSFEDAYADAVGENEWVRNTTSAEVITAIKANMANGALAVFFANEVIEESDALYNDSADNFALLGGNEADNADRVWAANGEWLELAGTKFADHTNFFARGYNTGLTGSSARSIVLRFGKTDSVQTVEDLNEGDARYFTLDGIEMNADRLAPGLYIRVLGSKAEKVLVK